MPGIAWASLQFPCGGSHEISTSRECSGGLLLALTVAWPAAAQVPAGVDEGWLGEFEHAQRQLLQLAEATPRDKFSWRPAPGVRSIAEVYMHIAVANYFLLGQAGIKAIDCLRPDEWRRAAMVGRTVTIRP
jgi:hypothetical protein